MSTATPHHLSCLCLLSVLCVLLCAAFRPVAAVENVILDTDIGGDIDDAGAMAILHALQRRGEIEILAIGVINGHVNTVPYVHAINTFFGQPDLPIGTIKGAGPFDRDNYMGPLLASYPHSRTKASAPEVVDLYRKILASQPDRSVTLIVIGQCTNISRLLNSGPDAHSSLNGVELVRRKVKFYAAGGNGDGNLPSGRCGHNYRTDLASANNELAKLPSDFATFFAGGSGPQIKIGNGLKTLPADDIILRSYQQYFKGGTNLDRPTWDQLRVLYGCRPAERSRWTHAGSGTISLSGETITWTASPQRNRSYGYVQNLTAMKTMLNNLMIERALVPEEPAPEEPTPEPMQLPFRGAPAPIPGRIQAEEYDLGGQQMAYYDTTAGNDKGLFRNDDVDLRLAEGGFSVGGIRAGEWLEYTVTVQTTGTYDLRLRVARQPTGSSTVRLSLAGGAIATASVPSTGSWSTWTTVVVPGVNLTAGNGKILRLAFDQGHLDLNWFEFALVTVDEPEPVPVAINFQPVNAPKVTGHLVDAGAVFADRGNGHHYGWSESTNHTRDRNTIADQRADTLNHMQNGSAGTVWEIAVPNGVYEVVLLCGDPSHHDSRYRVAVEGSLVLDATPHAGQRHFTAQATITVNDGRLTVGSAAGAENNKICAISILPVPVGNG